MSIEWLRQGKSVEDTTKLLTASTMLSKVGMIEASEATELMTSTLNGYKMGAEEALSLVDKLSAVDLAYATSAQEIAVAMQYVASSANQAGVDIDQLIGLITVGSETTRLSAETIGNAWKTLITRFQNVKLGKFTSDDGEDLNQVETILDQFGIKLRDTEDEWRNLGDVIDDIGNKWSELTSVEKSAIATQVAGTRQANIFIATMDNYNKVTDATKVSQDSAGTATEKYQHYIESLDAKVNQFISTWDKLVNNMNQSGFFGAVIDAGTTLIGVLDFLINDLNIIWTLGIPTALIAGIKIAKDNFSKLKESVTNYKSELKDLNDLYSKVIASTSRKTTKSGKIGLDLGAISEISQVRKAVDELNSLKIDNFSTEFQKWSDAVKPLNADIQALTLNTKGLNAEQIASVLAANNVSAADTAVALAKAGYNEQAIQSALVTSNLATTENAASIAATGYATATTAATASTGLLSKAVAGLTAVWNASPLAVISIAITAISAIINGIIWAIDECTTSIEELTEASEKQNQEFSTAISELDSLESELKRVNEQLDELSGKESPTYVEQEEIDKLKEVSRELDYQLATKRTIAKIEGEEAVSAQKNTIEASYGNYEDARQNIQGSMAMGQPILTIESGQDQILEQFAFIDELNKKIEEEKLRIQEANYGVSGIDFSDIEEASNRIEMFSWLVEQTRQKLETNSEGMSAALQDINTQLENYQRLDDLGIDMSPYKEDIESLKNARDMIMEVIDPEGFKELQWQNILNINELDSSIDKLKEQLDNGEISASEFEKKVSEEIRKVFDEIKNDSELRGYLIENGIDPSVLNDFENFKDIILSLLDLTSDLSDATNGIDWSTIPDLSNESALLGEFAENIDNLYNKYELLSQATQEYNENGYITTSLFKDLVDNNLVQYLSLTENGLIANTNALNNESSALIANAQNTAKVSLLKELDRIATEGVTDAQLESQGTAYSAATSNEQLFNSLANGVPKILTAASAMQYYNDTLGSSHPLTKDYEKQVENALSAFQNRMNAINSIANSLQGSLGGLSSGINKTGDSAENATQKLEDLKDTLTDDRKAIEDLLDLTMDMLKQQYQDEIDALEEVVEGIEEAHKTEQDRFDERKETAKDAYDLEIKNLEKEEKEYQRYYEGRKEALEDELDAYQKKINAELELLQLKEKEYQYEKELEGKIGDVADIQDQLAALEFDNSIEAQKKKLELAEELAEKQEDLDEFQHDHDVELSEDALNNELERFEDLQNKKLDALEKENKKKKEYYEEEKERLKDLYDNAIEQIEVESEAETKAYEKRKEEKEEEIERIEEYINREVNLRNEAITLIEGRTDKFYQDLIAYNREYGTGVSRLPIYSDMY